MNDWTVPTDHMFRGLGSGHKESKDMEWNHLKTLEEQETLKWQLLSFYSPSVADNIFQTQRELCKQTSF